MHAYLATVLRNHKCETLLVGGTEDHAHALFALSRNYSIATVVKEIKRTSSSWIKGISPRQAKFHWARWLRSVFGESVTPKSGYQLHWEAGATSPARQLPGWVSSFPEEVWHRIWRTIRVGLTAFANPFGVHFIRLNPSTQGVTLGWNWRTPPALIADVRLAVYTQRQSDGCWMHPSSSWRGEDVDCK